MLDNQENENLAEIDAMRMGVDYSFAVQMRNFSISLRPLSNSETMNCYQNVAEYLAKVPVHQRTQILQDNALAREILKMASAEFGKYPGSLTDPILDAMTNDEVIYLYKEWRGVCDRVNPELEQMEKEDIEKLVNDIKKNTPKDLDYQLTELSFGQMRSILFYLLTKGD